MRTGQGGEDLALAHLQALGFRLVARNHRCPRGEVDLIVERGLLLVFVEVRTRTGRSGGSPLETVGPAKQRKVVCAARDWLARAQVRDRELRFDVVGVVQGPGGPALTHSGSNTMWLAVAWLAPAKDFAVLVTCNQYNEKACNDAVLALIADHFKRE